LLQRANRAFDELVRRRSDLSESDGKLVDVAGSDGSP
jgi:hypothetical protein